MELRSVLRHRLATQRVTGPPLPTAADVVRLLTCVQAQEREHACFSLAVRSRSTAWEQVRAELDSGAFVRTHILRPTWHFVAAEDLRWVQDLTSPRVERALTIQLTRSSLDERHVGRALEILAEALGGRNFLTRKEIGARFAAVGLPSSGQDLANLVMVGELRGLVCGGPIRGVQHTYALVDEVVAPAPARTREEALAELARRFFGGHGPASIADFTRWASLTVTDASAALGEVGDRLERVDVDGVAHWYDPALVPEQRAAPAPFRAHLFPTYDEAVLTYPAVTFPPPEGTQPPASGQWSATVVVDDVRVGTWKRTVGRNAVTVESRLLRTLDDERRGLVDTAAERLGHFHGLPVRHVSGQT
ncbi:winged helix DNA-binding domain-containing protein [Actinopolymorpha sp. NPDC004070]|uniref:winged helix DNA-binding domain-containing protein n=1 Tax=Actinopolymorpha sp. NPDC004070 TaxID=3154548 RepID=UPI0033B8CA41